jgi:(2Fe-2S) ferredoxin
VNGATDSLAFRFGSITAIESLPPMPPFTNHIFVCCNCREPGNSRGCCDPEGTEKLKKRFKKELKARQANGTIGPGEVRANTAGCLDQCELGPVVVIYPRGIWYGRVTPEDVPRILDETVVGGRVLADLVIEAAWLNTKGKGPRENEQK